MNRRLFIRLGGHALAAVPILTSMPVLGRARPAAQSIPASVLRRIGITTVCFRDRFRSTRDKKAEPLAAGQELTLLTAPKFVADTLGLHNVEIWSAQFADTSIDYCQQIKAAAAAVGSRIINIQVDGSENLSDPDASTRTASVQTIKQWMDRAAAVGAPTLRANTGGGSPDAWDVNRTADSFRQLAEYGKKIGVKILIENHIGYSADIDKVVALARTVNDPVLPRDLGLGQHAVELSGGARGGAQQAVSVPRARFSQEPGLRRPEQTHQLRRRSAHQGHRSVGYRGIYSIEFYGRPPKDTVAAAKDMIQALAANIKGA